jgi:hypothetical protein
MQAWQVCAAVPMFKDKHQQDALDLLCVLLDSMRTEEIGELVLRPRPLRACTASPVLCAAGMSQSCQLKRVPNFIDDVFGGLTRSVVVCSRCCRPSVAIERCTHTSVCFPERLVDSLRPQHSAAKTKTKKQGGKFQKDGKSKKQGGVGAGAERMADIIINQKAEEKANLADDIAPQSSYSGRYASFDPDELDAVAAAAAAGLASERLTHASGHVAAARGQHAEQALLPRRPASLGRIPSQLAHPPPAAAA